MDPTRRIDRALHAALDSVSTSETPPTLIAALRHAVFPGGARIRPHLCLMVALACNDPLPELTDAVAVAVELLHCASLVHDDLPCFDDAPTRRGLPSVHCAFGQPLAVLAGDQLIVLAFETLARAAVSAPERLPRLIETVARGVGMPGGIIAGQAWESERRIPVVAYRRAKTAALFEAAAVGGAIAAGAQGSAWRLFGQGLGEAYQVADDIYDVAGNAADMGKPIGRDAALGRPNAAAQHGLHSSNRLFDQLLREAVEAIPPCADAERIHTWVHHLSDKLVQTLHVASTTHVDAGSSTA